MTTHDLNITALWFDRVKSGEKRVEIREHDRDYQAGDLLRLYEVTEYGNRKMTFVERDERGRFASYWVENDPIVARITHVLPHHLFPVGIRADYCALSIEVVS